MDRRFIDYSDWEEVKTINNYALFMGYMSMAVRGMGYLVVLWTTVILLGGFVSALEKKDFWSLTIITLVETVGPSEEKHEQRPQWLRRFGAFVAYLVQQLVFAVVAGPLALTVTVLYASGLVITTGLAAWRLLRRDYGGGGGGGTNMWAALDVLYTLVLLQGLLSYYRFSSRFCQERVAHDVAKAYGFPDPGAYESHTQCWRRWCTAHDSLHRYIWQTRIGCENDPSFAKGRNLVKYAVDTMKESEYSGCSRFIRGASILDALLSNPKLEEQHRLIKEHLVWSPSSGDLLQKVMQLLDSPRSYPMMYGVWIMTHLAGDLRPEQLHFPRGIHSIASLLEVPSEEEGTDFYFLREVAVEGLRLLGKLVAADDHWCRAVAEKEGMLANIMVPLSSDLHHNRYHHDERDGMPTREMPTRELIGASIQVMRRLVAAPGPTGDKLRREISSNRDAMDSVERILRCDQCDDCLLMEGALDIYSRLRGDDEPWTIATMREHFIKRLLLIFTRRPTDEDSMLLAGKMLAALTSQRKENTKIILQAKDGVGDLTKMLEEKTTKAVFRFRRESWTPTLVTNIISSKSARAEYEGSVDHLLSRTQPKCGIIAAQILEQLCIHHSGGGDDDEYVQNLKERLKVTMPKVLAKTLNMNGDYFLWYEQNREILTAVLSLSVTMSLNLMNAQDLAPLVDAITSEAAGFSILGNLNLIVHFIGGFVRRVTVNSLKTWKLVTEILILTVKHGSRDAIPDAKRLMKSLSMVAGKSSDLENFMVISGSSGPKTLNSLVKEAEEQLRRVDAPEMAVVIDHPSSVNGTQSE